MISNSQYLHLKGKKILISGLIASVLIAQSSLPTFVQVAYADESSLFNTMTTLFGFEKAKSIWSNSFDEGNSDYQETHSSLANAPAAFLMGSEVITLKPIADSAISQDNPSSNYGQSSQLNVDADEEQDSLLKFTVSDAGAVSSAKLRLYSLGSAKETGGTVYLADSNNWSESSVTWDNAPSTKFKLAEFGRVVKGEWYEVDVSAAVKNDGTYTFRINSDSSDGADYSSRQGSYAPQLVLISEEDTVVQPVGSGDEPIPEDDSYAPTVPRNLIASAISSSQIKLSWSASSDDGDRGAAGYRVSRNGVVVAGLDDSYLSYTSTGLEQYTAYIYSVEAFDFDGNFSEKATSKIVSTLNSDVPTTKFVKGDRVVVASGPLNVRSNPALAILSLGTQVQGRLGTVVSGPASAALYSWWKIDYDTGVDGWSAEDFIEKAAVQPPSVDLGDTTAPAVPGSLSASVVSASQINLSWRASSDDVKVVGYRVFRDGSKITTVRGTSYEDKDLNANTSYGYKILAYDAAGNESEETSSRSVKTLANASSADDKSYIFVGAGDIGGSETAKLIEKIIAEDPDTVVYTIGDNAYRDGKTRDFKNKYEPTWGKFKERTRPSPGNHDYHVSGARDYLEYFCPSSSDCVFPSGEKELYYSYNVGAWHIISLNSENDIKASGRQIDWLKADLKANSNVCVLAYFHRPLFSSGSKHGSKSYMSPFWDVLSDARADVVLGGHEHNYERFAPQTADGDADPDGIVMFVQGMGGGGGNYPFGTPLPNSEFRYSDKNRQSVTKFTLHDTSYEWETILDGGEVIDSGSADCVQ